MSRRRREETRDQIAVALALVKRPDCDVGMLAAAIDSLAKALLLTLKDCEELERVANDRFRE